MQELKIVIEVYHMVFGVIYQDHFFKFKNFYFSLHPSNQFGFKEKQSSDNSVFLLKQTINSYDESNTCVFSVFLDATKAFDQVNHYKLLKKLIARHVPTCFVRLLQYWYAHQTMQVKWDNCLSESFLVTYGVQQGSMLSPYLFAIYIDDLSVELNKLQAGCCIGNNLINHILFADD